MSIERVQVFAQTQKWRIDKRDKTGGDEDSRMVKKLQSQWAVWASVLGLLGLDFGILLYFIYIF